MNIEATFKTFTVLPQFKSFNIIEGILILLLCKSQVKRLIPLVHSIHPLNRTLKSEDPG